MTDFSSNLIFFGANAVEKVQQFSKDKRKKIILVDENTKKYCLPVFQKYLSSTDGFPLIEIKSGEKNKNLETCSHIWNELTKLNVERESVLINLGGGVLSDMGGFAASVFKRGIYFVHVPTTLLGMVDAAIGGKTGVNFQNYKNHIGAFVEPEAVYILPEFLKTLDERNIRAGFAEMIKHALIADEELFRFYCNHSFEECISEDILKKNIEIKLQIVLNDQKEKSIRKLLNFGHTVGHAIESVSLIQDDQPLLHGEAVAAGMICEAYISSVVNKLSQTDFEKIAKLVSDNFPSVPIKNPDALIKIMMQDKKNENGEINFTLLQRIGKGTIGHFCSFGLIKEALEWYQNKSTSHFKLLS